MFKYHFRKWNLHKNINKNQTRELAIVIRQRDAIGKGTEIWKGSRQVNYRRCITRNLKRNGLAGEALTTQQDEASLTSGHIRVATPPPQQLRHPEQLRRVELALSSIQNWFDGNANNPGWSPSRLDLAAGLDCFPLFVNGLRNLSLGSDQANAFREINQAFANARVAISTGQNPIVLLRFAVTLMAFREYPGSDICLHLCRSFLDYVRQLSRFAWPASHPVSTVWPLLEAYMDCSDDTEELAQLMRAMKAAARRCFGASSFVAAATVVYASTFELCIGKYRGTQDTSPACCIRPRRSVFELAVDEQGVMVSGLFSRYGQEFVVERLPNVAVDGDTERYGVCGPGNNATGQGLCSIRRLEQGQGGDQGGMDAPWGVTQFDQLMGLMEEKLYITCRNCKP